MNYWVEQLAADADKKIVERKNDMLDLELEKFMAHVIGKERFQSFENTWMWGYFYTEIVINLYS